MPERPEPTDRRTDAVLYGYPRSPSWQRVAVALNLKGIAHARVMVDLPRGDQRSPEHLERNPQGLVPVLEIDGLRLTQSVAILEYLEETRPTPRLVPREHAGRAMVRRFTYAIAADVSPLCNLAVSREVNERFGPAEGKSWLIGYLSSGISAAESLLQASETNDFCFGAEPTIADCVLFAHVRAAWRWGIDCRGAERVDAVYNHCVRHPAFAEVIGAG
jgi:maleylacetoacetate isomerase